MSIDKTNKDLSKLRFDITDMVESKMEIIQKNEMKMSIKSE